MGIDGGGVELVGLESQARQRGGPRALAGARAAEAEDRPVARRHVPFQAAVGGQCEVKIEDALFGDALFRPARRLRIRAPAGTA